ncbi:MAG: LCP family protein [Clostridia bacterium]|nr:LCP family protein [Clostridia bacterium]
MSFKLDKQKFWKFFGIFTGILLGFVVLLLVVLIPFNGFNKTVNLESLSAYEGGRKNVLIVGTDQSGLRADVILIASFPDGKGSVNVASIPRDTRMKLTSGSQKINTALAIGGEEMLVDKVKGVTGIEIHDFVKVNFKAVEEIVDKLGGVRFDVPQDMKYNDPEQDLYIDLKEGMQRLNGENALKLLRFRGYAMADIERTKVQREFLHAAFEQKAKLRYIFKIPSVMSSVSENMVTSVSSSDALSYVMRIKDKSDEGFNSVELPYYLSGSYVIITPDGVADTVSQYFE